MCVRKSLEETWRYLESEGEEMPRRPDGRPFVHAGMPNHDDDELGFHYFKAGLEDADNGNLTLPHTFFGRSRFARVSFANTDLSESRMCWNEFDECDFSAADLSRCDMRASTFKDCVFVRAILRGADLRRSTFDGCDFTGATLDGAMAPDENSEGSIDESVSAEQLAVMAFEGDGPVPPGG